MPRPKRPSDEAYNARKRMKRAAARAERAGNAAEAARLREQVSASYVRKPTRSAAQQVPQSANQAPTAPRAPRPKRPSDELHNARRRLLRQADKIEREAKSQTGEAKRLSEGFADYLRKQANELKGKKLDTSAQLTEIERLSRIREATKGQTYAKSRITRRNLVFKQQMNAAGIKDADSSISEREQAVFWATVKGLWPKGSDVPRNERYDRIADYFYSANSTTAKRFRAWLQEQKDTRPEDVYGDLTLIYEFVTKELNDPSTYEDPDTPYPTWIDKIIFAR